MRAMLRELDRLWRLDVHRLQVRAAIRVQPRLGGLAGGAVLPRLRALVLIGLHGADEVGKPLPRILDRAIGALAVGLERLIGGLHGRVRGHDGVFQRRKRLHQGLAELVSGLDVAWSECKHRALLAVVLAHVPPATHRVSSGFQPYLAHMPSAFAVDP